MRKIGAPTRKVARKVLAHSKIINIENQNKTYRTKIMKEIIEII